MSVQSLALILSTYGEEGDSKCFSTSSRLRHRPRQWPRLLTRAARRPWLRCKHCGARLVQADVMDGATRLPIGRAYSDGDVPIYCPNCGTHRQFHQNKL